MNDSSQRQQQYVSSPGRAVASMTSQLQNSTTRSPAERKKDIVAQAMQEQKIFEDSLPKTEVKQEPGVLPAIDSKPSTKPDTKPVVTATKTPTPVAKPVTVNSKPVSKASQQVRVG